MNVVAALGQPERVDSRRTAHVEDRGRRRGCVPLDELARAHFFQPRGTVLETGFLGRTAVKVENGGIDSVRYPPPIHLVC